VSMCLACWSGTTFSPGRQSIARSTHYKKLDSYNRLHYQTVTMEKRKS